MTNVEKYYFDLAAYVNIFSEGKYRLIDSEFI